MECARPFGDEGERLGESLADDGTGFVREPMSESDSDAMNKERLIAWSAPSSGCVSIRGKNEPVSVVK